MIFANNLIANEKSTTYPIKAYDKIDGVKFKNNLWYLNSTNQKYDRDDFEQRNYSNLKISSYITASADDDIYSGFGFENFDTDLFGNARTKENNKIGAITNSVSEVDSSPLLDRKKYGPTWFSVESKDLKKTLTVSNAEELKKAVETAANGSTIKILAGNYALDDKLVINKHLILWGGQSSGNTTSTIISNANSLFEIHPYGNLELNDLEFAGDTSQNFISTDKDQKMYANYNLKLNHVVIDGFHTVLEVTKGSFADEIIISNTTIKNCKNGLLLDQETDDKGDYNVEFLTITNSTFENITNEVIDFYRGGYDESTIGGVLNLSNNTFLNCGKQDEDDILINTRGIVNVIFAHNTFKNNGTKITAVLWGAKGQQPENNTIINSGEIKVVENIALKLVY